MRCRLLSSSLPLACVVLAPDVVRAQSAPPAPSGPIFGAVSDAAAAPAPRPEEPARVAVLLHYIRGPGAESCPDERGLRGAVAARMGYDPFASAPGPLSLVRVSIVQQGGAFVAVAERRDPAGRVIWKRPPLSDPDCRQLVNVLGLSLSIELDPRAESAMSPAGPPTVHPPPSSSRLPDPPAPVPPASPRPAIRFGMRAGLAIGTLARPTATLAADVGVGWPLFSVAVEGRADMPVTGDVAYGKRLRTSLLAVSLVPCGHWKWLVGCGVISVGALRIAGENFTVPNEDSGVHAAAGLRAGVEWPIPRLAQIALRASAEVLVTVQPMTVLRTNDAAKLWETPPFAGLLGAGTVMRF
jgi:hypothetical protein